MATPPPQLTPDDLRHLARLAGLEIAPEREDAVLAELNGQVANVNLIESLLPSSPPVAAQPYNPTFPPVRVDDEVAR